MVEAISPSIPQVYNDRRVPASDVVEYVATQNGASSAVYIYDLAEQVGFGLRTKQWSELVDDGPSVIELQTRAGAGLSIVGRLTAGPSRDFTRGSVLTAYTTPVGLSSMAPSFMHLPKAIATSRLILHVPTLTPVGKTLAPVASLSPIVSVWSLLSKDPIILLSSRPQQIADFAAIAHKLTDSHVIHFFDHQGSARETGTLIKPFKSGQNGSTQLSDLLSASGYNFFEFHGDAASPTVLVLLNGPLALLAKAYAQKTNGFGVVIVNVLRPWDDNLFAEVLPSAARELHVFDDVPSPSAQGILFGDVFGALLGRSEATIRSHRIMPSQTAEFLQSNDAFLNFCHGIAPSIPDNVPLQDSAGKKLLFLSDPHSTLSTLPRRVGDIFFSSKGILARSLVDYDVFSKTGGIAIHRLLLSSKIDENTFLPFTVALPLEGIGQADFVGVLDPALAKTHSILSHAKPGAPVLIVTSCSAEEVLSQFPSSSLATAQEKKLRLFTINVKSAAEAIKAASTIPFDVLSLFLAHLAFLRLYLGHSATEANVFQVAQSTLDGSIAQVLLQEISHRAWEALEEIVVPPPPVETMPSQLKNIHSNSFVFEASGKDDKTSGARLGTWHDAAKHLLFPSVFSPFAEDDGILESSLRPEIPDRTYLVTCTVNRRLTPLEYDRNVFHLEFDTTGTGLTYAIGEALGVHGWNDEHEVLDFCAWYGVDPNRLITIPLATREGQMHTRTVLQALQQQIDIFGHPPKSFYTELASFATSPVDRHTLFFIGSSEGSATYKKLSEKDTVTFADILRRYPSAKPGIEKLCEMVGDIKPRHYSIASSQSVVGNRVDLLVVTVEWLTPDGTCRLGQCTRYLAGLRVGQKVTVSVKPSVMKLPPDPRQPIIMAGLGTGAAPFRAFLQHLAWLTSQGQEIGPVYYYFGSRHRAAEYLYGEEVEAFILDGIITRAGLAFSRDGIKKVYIQHKMLEDSESLVEVLYDQRGVFYLCGPTWPVPDVHETLVNALVKYKALDPNAAALYLENMKEEERYVLEVY